MSGFQEDFHDDHHDCGHDHSHDHEHIIDDHSSAMPLPLATVVTNLAISVFAALREQAVWLVIGLTLAAALSQIPSLRDRIVSLLSPQRRLAVPIAALVGIAVPLCSCAALPLAALLARRGVDAGAVVAFLIASQAAGLDSAITTVALVGVEATLLRLFNALVAASICGYLTSLFATSSRVVADAEDDDKKAKDKSAKGNGKHAQKSLINGFIEQLVSLFSSVAPWLIVGEIATQLLAPLLTSRINDAASRLILFTVVLPVQLCEHGTAALVRTISKTFSDGVASTVLVLAPAVNIGTLVFLNQTIRGSAIIVCVGLVGWALVTSLVIDQLGVTSISNAPIGDHDQFHPWMHRAAEVIVVILALLAVQRGFRGVFFGFI
jgi:uncharacterized membrane protein YraQ (UPF0718 family)